MEVNLGTVEDAWRCWMRKEGNRQYFREKGGAHTSRPTSKVSHACGRGGGKRWRTSKNALKVGSLRNSSFSSTFTKKVL